MPSTMNLSIIANYSNNVQIDLTMKEYIAIVTVATQLCLCTS